jgi:prepilin-type N-terminal cleavage/methylation domain-containing protein
MTHNATARPARKQTAFSLIELLVVIIIIGILVSIGIAVGLKVLGGSAKQDTLAAQEMTLDIVMRYYDITDNYPGYYDGHSLRNTSKTNPYVGNALLEDLAGDLNAAETPAGVPDETRKMVINNLKDYLQPGDTPGGKWTLVDGWGNEMRYTSNGIGGQPALISAGEDGLFGDKVKNKDGFDLNMPGSTTKKDNDPANSEDNIRSDAGQ